MGLRKAAEAIVGGVRHDVERGRGLFSDKHLSDLEHALSQPDMLAEAVELLRAVRRGCNCGYDYLCSACQAAINASRFVSRYDAAQQEQNK